MFNSTYQTYMQIERKQHEEKQKVIEHSVFQDIVDRVCLW